jgi:hypothetical protein
MRLVDRFALAFATTLLSRGEKSPADVAHEAYDLAEAMLRERAARREATEGEQSTLSDGQPLVDDEAAQMEAWARREREMAELAEMPRPLLAQVPDGPGLAKAGLREAPQRARTG